MPLLPLLLKYLGYCLAVVFLVRFARNGFVPHYPFFSAYLFFMTARLVLVASISDKLYTPFFNQLFWSTSNLLWVLSLGVVWEVLRQFIPRRHPLRPLAVWASVLLLTGLAGSFWWMGPEGVVFSDLERKLPLTIAAWLTLAVGLGLFYGLPAPRPVWGMAWGMGIVASLTLVNFAVLGLLPQFGNAWGLIRQSGFSLVMLIWLWTFWDPPAPRESDPTISSTVLLTWQNNWERLMAAVRRIFRS